MAIGPVCRANRPDTCCTDQACDVYILLADPEPSTHAAVVECPLLRRLLG